MRLLRTSTTLFCMALMGAALLPRAKADEWDRKDTGDPELSAQIDRQTVMTFRERPGGQPEALRAWFYPGRNWGEEFVYPKAKALELAAASDTVVLFTPAEIALEVTGPIVSADAPPVMELKRVPVMAIRPTGEEAEIAEVVTPPPAQAEVAATAPVTEKILPQMASLWPLIGLFGLLALCGAVTLRFVQKRIL